MKPSNIGFSFITIFFNRETAELETGLKHKSESRISHFVLQGISKVECCIVFGKQNC
jgi:hypothetical protein